MRKTAILTPLACALMAQLPLTVPVVAQVSNADQARAFYFQAETAFNDGEYKKTLDYLDDAERILGRSAPIFLALEAKTQWELKNYDATRAAIDALYANPSTTETLKAETSSILIGLVEKEQAAQDQADRDAQIEQAKQFYLLELKDKKSTFRTQSTPAFDTFLNVAGSDGQDGQYDFPGERYYGDDGQEGLTGKNGKNGGRMHIVIRESRTYDYAMPVGLIERRTSDGTLVPFSGIHPQTGELYMESRRLTRHQGGAATRILSPVGPVAYIASPANVPPYISFKSVPHDFERKLILNASGGKGGNGSRGQKGSPGLDASERSGTNIGQDGGDGGRGGKGGNGGNGGEIRVDIYGSEKFIEQVKSQIVILTNGGAAGEGGPGGYGGKGGDMQRYGLWGENGKSGPEGPKGRAGVDGTQIVRTFRLDQYQEPPQIFEFGSM